MYQSYLFCACLCTLAGICAALMGLALPSVGLLAGCIYFAGLYALAWLFLCAAERQNKQAIRRN